MPNLVTSGRARDIPAKVRALIPGSTEAPCRVCGEVLLLAPSSQTLMAEGALLLCPSCVERMLERGEQLTVEITDESIAELRRALLHPRDEELN